MKHEHEHQEHEHEHEALPCDTPGHVHHHHEDGSCCCEQHAKEFHGVDKPMLVRLIVSAVLFLFGKLVPMTETAEMLIMLCAALIACYDVLWGAIGNLFRARIFDEYFLMSFAAVAAFLIREYEEAAAVFVLYRVGAFCQSYAIRHSRRTIAHLTGDDTLLDDDGKISNRFITRFARIYTPIILALAFGISIALPLLGSASWHDSIYRALTFLVLACPCAIVISVPLAYFAGIGAAGKKGIFFHDSAAVDIAATKELTVTEENKCELGGETVYDIPVDTRAGEKSRIVMIKSENLSQAKQIAKRTRLVALENVWFTILVKLAVIVLAICGISALWFAVFADTGVTVIVVLNALRAFYIGKQKS